MLEEYTMEETKQQQGRSPDSLIQAIDRIERLEKQLKIAVDALSWYDGLEDILISWELLTGQKKGMAKQALDKIKELEK